MSRTRDEKSCRSRQVSSQIERQVSRSHEGTVHLAAVFLSQVIVWLGQDSERMELRWGSNGVKFMGVNNSLE